MTVNRNGGDHLQYRQDPKQGRSLSVLGYGCMRYTRRGTGIDQEKAAREMRLAVESGVNYFDTAYIYPGSEECLGRFLEENGLRDKVVVTTKLPQYLVRKPEDLDRYFAEQLRRLRTDRVDYYLMHMLNDVRRWESLLKNGVVEWIGRMKREGRIGGIGFSFHGGTEEFLRLLDVYDWDICQVQFNYIDENAQAGLAGVRAAHARGIPVVVMEPLRGGRLARLSPAMQRAFDAAGKKLSGAQWGLRWVMSHEEVTVVLSGMNDEAQVRENLETAESALPGCLSPEEEKAFADARAVFLRDTRVLCTGCGYCMPCPAGVDIPNCFQAYNLSWSEGLVSGLKSYFMCNAMRDKPSLASRCVGCGKCESHCPQGIHVRDELKNVRRRLESPLFKLVMKGERILHR